MGAAVKWRCRFTCVGICEAEMDGDLTKSAQLREELPDAEA